MKTVFSDGICVRDDEASAYVSGASSAGLCGYGIVFLEQTEHGCGRTELCGAEAEAKLPCGNAAAAAGEAAGIIAAVRHAHGAGHRKVTVICDNPMLAAWSAKSADNPAGLEKWFAEELRRWSSAIQISILCRPHPDALQHRARALAQQGVCGQRLLKTG